MDKSADPTIEQRIVQTFLDTGITPLSLAILRVIESSDHILNGREIGARVFEDYGHKLVPGTLYTTLRRMEERKELKLRKIAGSRRKMGYDLTAYAKNEVLPKFNY